MGMPDHLQPPTAEWVWSHKWGRSGAFVIVTLQTNQYNPCFSGMFLILAVSEKPSMIDSDKGGSG